MADKEGVEPRDGDEPEGSSDESTADEPAEQHQAEFRMELCDSLPGDRAVVGVEQDGEFMWLASRKYVHQKAVDEFVDQLQRIVREGWWVQNWSGR
ncbi:hypothetical protein ACWERY_15925 [Streptomyces sp. NPDC004082]